MSEVTHSVYMATDECPLKTIIVCVVCHILGMTVQSALQPESDRVVLLTWPMVGIITLSMCRIKPSKCTEAQLMICLGLRPTLYVITVIWSTPAHKCLAKLACVGGMPV